MEVFPPSKSRNGDRSVFFDTLQLKPFNDGSSAVFHVGSRKEELTIPIKDNQASVEDLLNHSTLERTTAALESTTLPDARGNKFDLA